MDGTALAAKLVATPLVIVAVHLVERRFGHAVAGLVFGFPLTSSLAAAFLAAEQGAAFTRATVPGLLAGITTLAAFVLAFGMAAARRAPWPLALAWGAAAYAPTALALAWWGPAFAPAVALALAALGAAALAMPRPRAGARPRPHGRWELPLRATVGTAIVVGLTLAADRLGPLLTGLVLLVPAVTATLSCFVLARGGADPLLRMLRGLALGCFSFVAFFIVLGRGLTVLPTALAFVLAGVAAVGCSGVTWRLGVARAGDPVAS